PADTVGPAIVGGIGGADLGDERQRRLGRFDRSGQREEAAVLDLDLVAGALGEGGAAHRSGGVAGAVALASTSSGKARVGWVSRSAPRLARARSTSPLWRCWRIRSIQSPGSSRRSLSTGTSAMVTVRLLAEVSGSTDASCAADSALAAGAAAALLCI